MGAITYERPKPAAAEPPPEITYENPRAGVVPDEPQSGKTGAGYFASGVTGAAGLAAALALRRLGRIMVPGVGLRPTVLGNVANELNRGLRAKDSSTNIFKALDAHEKFQQENGPVNFLQWMALHGNKDTDRTILEFLSHSGQAKEIGEALGLTRDIDKNALANLYKKAFTDKSPIINGKVLEVLQRHGPAMQAALEDSLESMKYDPRNKIPIVNVPVGKRKDAWKWEQFREVPEMLRFGEPRNGLQKAVVPNIENLDRMKRALWTLAQKRAKAGEGDVGAIHQARVDLTNVLDEIAPSEYRQARTMAQQDFEEQAAQELGEKLGRSNPAYIESVMAGLKPAERRALVQGAAFKKFGQQLPATENSRGIFDYVRARASPGETPRIFDYLNFPVPIGFPSKRASTIGTEWLLGKRPPQSRLERMLGRPERPPLDPRELTPGLGKIPATMGGELRDLGVAGVVGGGGGLSAYALPDAQPGATEDPWLTGVP